MLATRPRVAATLRQAEADVIMLYLNAERYHWNSVGEKLHDLHLLFEEIALSALSQVELLAQRAREVGGDTPDEAPAASIQASVLKGSVAEMLTEALRNQEKVMDEMQEAARIALEEGDHESAALFEDALEEHERHAWQLCEALRRGDAILA